MIKRKTTQFLIPEKIEPTRAGEYDIYPGLKIPEGSIKKGHAGLADFIIKHKTVAIDGYAGVFLGGVM